MFSSLGAFCARQFLGRHITLACRLVVEEITERYLIPVARKHGIEDPEIAYELTIGEGGDKALLVVDSRKFVKYGVTDAELLAASDEVSGRVLRSMTSDYSVERPGVLHLTIE